MLRITLTDAANGFATLRLEGQLAGPWIDELRAACEPILAHPRALTLDLTHVSLIDRAGFAFLDSLSQRGVTLAGCSPFQSEQLRQSSTAPCPTPTTP